MKLSGMARGERGRVLAVTASGKIKRRLFDMGVTPGAEIEVKEFAPLGDPMYVLLRGYSLCLRKVEAQEVAMEESDEKE